MKATQRAYWAGILDGEGSIDITRTYHQTKLGKHVYHFMRMAVYNRKRSLIEDAIKEFGMGSIQTHTMTRQISGKTYPDSVVYSWTVTTNKACHVLKLLLPFLRLKKEKAKLAIAFQETKENTRGRVKGGNYAHLSEKELEWREQCRSKMKHLNGRRPYRRLAILHPSSSG
jgi:hypothetical protein